MESSEAPRERGGMGVREAARKGGKTTAERHGSEHYRAIGRRGGQRVKALVEQGRRAEERDA